MRSCALLILFLTALVSVSLPHKSLGATVYVSTDGADSPSCGSLEAPCSSISFAMSNVSDPGDTIMVGDGTFSMQYQTDARNTNQTLRATNPHMVVIHCATASRPALLVLHALVIDGLIFEQCTNRSVVLDRTDGTVEIDNCIFRDNSLVIDASNANAYGAASTGGAAILASSSSTLRLRDCEFVNNTVQASKSTYSKWIGGAAVLAHFTSEYTIEITGGRFHSNQVDASRATSTYSVAGAVLLRGNGKSTISHCSFVANRVTGGAVFSTLGAALVSTRTYISISDSEFSDNTALGSAYFQGTRGGEVLGGACYLGDTSQSITGCTFRNNSAHGEKTKSVSTTGFCRALGGAVCSEVARELLRIENSTFDGNQAIGVNLDAGRYGGGNGGAVSIQTSKQIAVRGCRFSNNRVVSGDRAYGLGGALLIVGADAVTLNHCLFSGNSAFGGNNTDADNVAALNLPGGSASGGGVAVTPASQLLKRQQTLLSLDDCSFVGNQARSGDGLLVPAGQAAGGALALTHGSLYMTDSKFVNNSAILGRTNSSNVATQATGGAVNSLHGTDEEDVNITSTVFIGNGITGGDSGIITPFTPRSIGGGGVSVSLAGGLLNVTGCKFSKNYLKFVPVSRFPYTYTEIGHAKGGALLITSTTSSHAKLYDNEFSDNLIDCSPKTKLGSTCGGAAVMSFFMDVRYWRSNFTRNSVIASAGTVWGGSILHSTGVLSLIQCRFSSNSVSLQPQSCQFWSDGTNTAGGAVFGMISGIIGILSVFDNNTATISCPLFTRTQASGGAIWSGGLQLTACAFLDNSVVGPLATGGAIGRSPVIANNMLFIPSNLEQCVFERNSAHGFSNFESSSVPYSPSGAALDCLAAGGAIGFVSSSHETLSISGSIFRDNQAAVGGAIHFASSTEGPGWISLENGTFTNNHARLDGGALAVGLDPCQWPKSTANSTTDSWPKAENVNLFNISITRNSADRFGGATWVSAFTSASWFNHTTIDNNSAGTAGAASFIIDARSLAQLQQIDTSVTNNSAPYGSEWASLIQSLESEGENEIYVFPGQRFVLQFWLLDHLGQRVNRSELSLHLSSPAIQSQTLVSGVPGDSVSSVPESATFEFPNARVIGNSSVIGESFVVHANVQVQQQQQDFGTNISIGVVGCPPPYYLNRVECQLCTSTSYLLDSNSDESCIDCPEGSSIPCVQPNDQDTGFSVSPGLWLSPSLSNPSRLLPCYTAKSCRNVECLRSLSVANGSWSIQCIPLDPEETSIGWPSDTQCSPGYSDRLCSRCFQNETMCYFRLGNECVNVEDGPSWARELLLIIVVVFGTVCWNSSIGSEQYSTKKTLSFFFQVTVLLNSQVFSRVVGDVFGFLGLVSSGGVATIHSSSSFTQSILDSNAKLFGINSIECLIPLLHSPEADFWRSMLYPFLVILPLILIVTAMRQAVSVWRLAQERDIGLREISWSNVFLSTSKSTRPLFPTVADGYAILANEDDDQDHQYDDEPTGCTDELPADGSMRILAEPTERDRNINTHLLDDPDEFVPAPKFIPFYSRCIEASLFLCYSVLLGLTGTIVNVFACSSSTIDGSEEASFMSTIPWVQCSLTQSSTWRHLVWSGLGFLVVYVVGIPALFGVLLYQTRKLWLTPDKAKAGHFLRFFCAGLRSKYFWFEVRTFA